MSLLNNIICKFFKHQWKLLLVSLEGDKEFECSRCKKRMSITPEGSVFVFKT